MGKLYKSRNDAVVFGVIGGLAEYFNIDPVLLRVIVVVVGFMTGGTPVVPYLILALIMPEEPKYNRRRRRNRDDRKEYRRNYRREAQYEYERPTRKEVEDVSEDDWSDF
jgi:phage shock protein PspC (stress-responsive transcriptional regulator)